LLSVGVRPNDSSRVTAINIQPNGDSGTPVGPLPAKGFRTALTTLDIAVTTATGAGGAATVGCAGCCTSALTALAARTTDTLGARAGSSATFADSVAWDCTVWAAAVPVFGVEPTAACVVLLDGCEPLDFFFFFGAGSVTAAVVSLESGCLVCDASVLVCDAEVPGAPDVLDGSADATPCPTKTAAPIPRATASPPIRPTYAPAPMPMYLTVDKSARLRLERFGLDCVAGG
jgi:hypothetical protein